MLEVLLPRVFVSAPRKPIVTPTVAPQATRLMMMSTLEALSKPTLVQGESKLVGPQQQQPFRDGMQQPALPRVAIADAAFGLQRRRVVMTLAMTLSARKKAARPTMMRTRVVPVAMARRERQMELLSFKMEPPEVWDEQYCSHQEDALLEPLTVTGLLLEQ